MGRVIENRRERFLIFLNAWKDVSTRRGLPDNILLYPLPIHDILEVLGFKYRALKYSWSDMGSRNTRPPAWIWPSKKEIFVPYKKGEPGENASLLGLNFTMTHELSHWLLEGERVEHRERADFPGWEEYLAYYNKQEQQADLMAYSLLMPSAAFKVLGSIYHCFVLARYFGIHPLHIVMRALHLIEDVCSMWVFHKERILPAYIFHTECNLVHDHFYHPSLNRDEYDEVFDLPFAQTYVFDSRGQIQFSHTGFLDAVESVAQLRRLQVIGLVYDALASTASEHLGAALIRPINSVSYGKTDKGTESYVQKIDYRFQSIRMEGSAVLLAFPFYWNIDEEERKFGLRESAGIYPEWRNREVVNAFERRHSITIMEFARHLELPEEEFERQSTQFYFPLPELAEEDFIISSFPKLEY